MAYFLKGKYCVPCLFHRSSCGNCALDRLQNPGECLCCKEIEKCVESLRSAAVLNEVEVSPECITLHPGFGVVCLVVYLSLFAFFTF